MQHFSPEKRDRTEVGVEVRAAEEIIPEDNSTPEREVETEIQIQTKTNHLEMSPPLGRYEQSQFEKTFNHKLDNMSVKELNGMKESTLAKIKEIEEKFLDEKAHENSLQEKITQDQDAMVIKKKKIDKTSANYPTYSRG